MSERQTSVHRRVGLPILAGSDRLTKFKKPTPERPMFISASEVRDFRRCRVKWNLRHNIRVEPTETPEALAIGRVGHEILDLYYQLPSVKRTPKRMQKIAAAHLKKTSPKLLDTPNKELVQAMVIGFAEWCQDDDNPKNDDAIGLVKVFPEEWFDLPLNRDGSIRMRGKLDVRWAPEKRVMAIQETKFKGQIKVDAVDFIDQLTTYFWAMRKKWPKTKEFRGYYTILRKQLPGPRVTAALFHRESVTRLDEELDQWEQDAVRTAHDMLDAAIYPTPDESCSYTCDFQIPCMMRGSEDFESIIREKYQPKERN